MCFSQRPSLIDYFFPSRGQTTLLNILADRVARGPDTLITGDVRFNGAKMNSALKKQFGYVTQTDIVYETATPRECTVFSAMLRLEGLSRGERLVRAEGVLQRLRLTKARRGPSPFHYEAIGATAIYRA